jgi:hypothetical protein
VSNPVPPPLEYDAPRKSKRKKIGRFLVALALVAIVATGASYWWKDRSHNPALVGGIMSAFAAQNDTLARAPSGVRVRVRVINTTKTDGLAKKATATLRDRGFDVVDYEGDSRNPRDSTLVLTHTGHADWSARVIRALGVGTMELRPDSSRYLDLTVMIGRDWKPPTQPFRP